MSNIMPCLWFDDRAEEAANFYVSVFRGCGRQATIDRIARYGESGRGKPGTVMTVIFTLAGQEFMALNGGPHFTFSPATSLVVKCGDQGELDRFWNGLISGGGRPSQCGWLTDKFGFSWQVVPALLGDLQNDPDPVRSDRVMRAVLGMVKLDIGALEAAYEGR